jgi:hypothetical protein
MWKTFSHILFPAALLVISLSSNFRQRNHIVEDIANGSPIINQQIPPLVTSTRLSDSIPTDMLRSLGFSNVTGVKYRQHTGMAASYFTYRAEREKLIYLLSVLPFKTANSNADIVCHNVPFDTLSELKRKAHPMETQGEEFWMATAEDFDLLESIKPPHRHTLLISKTDSRVIHRIATL